MKKLSLVMLFAFLLVFALLFMLQKKPDAKRVAFLKNVNSTQLEETASLDICETSYTIYLYGDSLFLLSEAKDIISTDTGLHGIRRYAYPFDLGSNAVWYFSKEGAAHSFLSYPDGSIIQQHDKTFKRLTQYLPINNCVNTANIFWGQTSDSTDTKLFITSFDMNDKRVRTRYDLYQMFRTMKGFSPDCFNTSMDGSFVKINDSSFLFYNYFSSYFVWFNDHGYKIYTGIDSFPLRKFRKIAANVGKYKVEKCASENERFVHLSGCSDSRNVYILSNISSRRLNGQLLVDVYDAQGMKYRTSYLIRTRNNSRPTDITTAAGSRFLYVIYDDNTLVKYTKPL